MRGLDLQKYMQDLANVVNMDSNGFDPEGTTKVADYFINMFQGPQWHIKRVDVGEKVAHAVQITNTTEDAYDVLLMAHMDTVFDRGEAAKRPFKIDNGRAYGPGVIDMKSGCLLGIHALLNCAEELQPLRICLALNPEEEKGSRHVRPWFEELSKKSRYAIVLEPARPLGEHVLERKGLGRYTIKFHGKAAHAGNNHQDGCSAINEMAHWICNLVPLTNYEQGFTINIGTVKGGIGTNTIAAEAEMEIDLRMAVISQHEAFLAKVEELQAHAAAAEITVELIGGVTRPPMFKTEKTDAFVALVNEEAVKLGLGTKWLSVGGGSDGNFSAALGVPTIDAMGPIGGKAHTVDEYLEVDSIEPAYKLFVNVMLRLKEQLYPAKA
ncbi:MAG: M20 family metallopeptidase [Phascolarctobacterium sp.]